MNHDVTPIVRDWLADTAAPIGDPVAIYPAVVTAMRQTPQRRSRLPLLPPWRTLDLTTATSVLLAGLAVTMLGGFLYLSSTGNGQDPDALPAAVAPSATSAAPTPALTPAPSSYPVEPRLPKGFVDHDVRVEASLMLPGQVQTAVAEMCTEAKCEPATSARWVVETKKYRDLIEPRRGSPVRVTAKDKVGGMSIRVKGRWGKDPNGKVQGAAYATGVTVRPKPGVATRDWRRRHGGSSWVFPDEQVLRLGQYVVLTGWLCPDSTGIEYGLDGVPGTPDDACVISPIRDARPLPGSGMSQIGIFGSSALMRVDEFVDLGGNLNATGVMLRYGDVPDRELEIPWLYVRNGRWDGPLLGDVDGDGDVDPSDRSEISGALEPGTDEPISPDDTAWREQLDLNRDRIIDSVDLEILDALIEARAAE